MARVEAARRLGLVIDYIVTDRFVKRHAKSTKLRVRSVVVSAVLDVVTFFIRAALLLALPTSFAVDAYPMYVRPFFYRHSKAAVTAVISCTTP